MGIDPAPDYENSAAFKCICGKKVEKGEGYYYVPYGKLWISEDNMNLCCDCYRERKEEDRRKTEQEERNAHGA